MDRGYPFHSVMGDWHVMDSTVLSDNQVWKMPESIGDERKGEEAALRRLAAADDFDEALRKNQSRGV